MAEPRGRVALVTGAGSGIGRAVARALFAEGYRLALVGRRMQALDELARALGGGRDAILVYGCDVGNPEAVRALFADVATRFGRLDLLFNNAGTAAPMLSVEEIPFEAWSAVLQTNLTGAFLCTQQAIRLMKVQKPRGGRIINNGSISAYAPRPGSAAYTASKHALAGLTKSTSLDCRGFDIACGQIDIGNAATEMTQAVAEGIVQANGARMVEPRIDVEHVARMVVHMAGLPLDTNVLFMTIMANDMPFVGRG